MQPLAPVTANGYRETNVRGISQPPGGIHNSVLQPKYMPRAQHSQAFRLVEPHTGAAFRATSYQTSQAQTRVNTGGGSNAFGHGMGGVDQILRSPLNIPVSTASKQKYLMMNNGARRKGAAF